MDAQGASSPTPRGGLPDGTGVAAGKDVVSRGCVTYPLRTVAHDRPPADRGFLHTGRHLVASTAKKRGGTAHESLSVRHDEDAWTAEELAEVRAELEADVARLGVELDEAEHDLVEMMRSYADGAGDDQADAGAATWEREHELSLANNARDLLMQTLRALERINTGSYGDCEACGNPIGKMRLQAFPRATLCMTCKQKQERR